MKLAWQNFFQKIVNEKYCLIVVVFFSGSVVEWLKHRAHDQYDLGSKPTRAIVLGPWERHFTTFSPAWWS